MKTILKILLLLCFFPFSLLYFVFRKKKKRVVKYEFVSESPAEKKHYAMMQKIDELYSSVMFKKDYTSKRAQSLERICKEDIALAPAVWDAQKKTSAAPPSYPSYRQLVTLYERRGDYEQAAKICRQAIHDGYNDDGTQMKMSGRLERIKAKMKK